MHTLIRCLPLLAILFFVGAMPATPAAVSMDCEDVWEETDWCTDLDYEETVAYCGSGCPEGEFEEQCTDNGLIGEEAECCEFVSTYQCANVFICTWKAMCRFGPA